MSRPSFFIVGHSKSGTTALSRFLDEHPHLFLCRPEEPNYFVPSLCRALGPPSTFFRRCEEEYLALFDGALPEQRCGEASAVYLFSTEAAERIARFDPHARIIMIFREPASFLRSYHLQMLKNTPTEGETVQDLREAIGLEPARREGRELPPGCLIPELLTYATDRLRYDEHYDRFAARFPPDQILALIYDDFRDDNPGTTLRVFRFLGVDLDFRPDFQEHNTGGLALRSRRREALVRRLTHSGGVVGTARTRLPKRLRRRAVATAYSRFVFTEPEEMDADLARAIRRRAEPHVAGLGERLGQDLLGRWGYR
jgi:hypothetical protein